MEILPPFETPVGHVGLSICFDVSRPSCTADFLMEMASNGVLLKILLIAASIPRDKSST